MANKKSVLLVTIYHNENMDLSNINSLKALIESHLDNYLKDSTVEIAKFMVVSNDSTDNFTIQYDQIML